MSEAFIEGLGTTVVGMLIVFTVLGCLCFVLYLFQFLPKEQLEKDIKETENSNLKVLQNKVDDMELVAVITAVIAATLGTTTDKLLVKSITKAQNWNSVARKEQQRNIS